MIPMGKYTFDVTTERRKLEMALFGERRIPQLLRFLPEYFWLYHIAPFLKANITEKLFYNYY